MKKKLSLNKKHKGCTTQYKDASHWDKTKIIIASEKNLTQTGLFSQLCANAARDYSMRRLYARRRNSAMEHQRVGKEMAIVSGPMHRHFLHHSV